MSTFILLNDGGDYGEEDCLDSKLQMFPFPSAAFVFILLHLFLI